ncbi:MAG: MotA/TolQ/ExbB proton channel family protein [Planctomycetia bacterium]|nr:MAG: MotA/TolQ/ExbB proton channel family protein [Planctomycetia bacterium]
MSAGSRWIACAGLGLLTAAPALAQHGGGDGKSLLKILWDGVEWPAYIILAGSIAAITLIVEHFINVRAATVVPAEQVKRVRGLIEARKYRECVDTVKRSSTFFAVLMSSSLQHGRHGYDAMHTAAAEKAGEMAGRMFRKVEYLNIIGNLGPLMGLLGTVLGMIVTFANMGGGGGSADSGALSRGISLALVNTLLGLGLAVVGMGFYGVCRNRIDALTAHATVEALDIIEHFRVMPARGEAAAAPTAPPATTEPRGAPVAGAKA